jgi:hypothetical protein
VVARQAQDTVEAKLLGLADKVPDDRRRPRHSVRPWPRSLHLCQSGGPNCVWP